MPLVSVVMPSYNHEKYISDAIESVLNQSFIDLELIIIDDASNDNSKKIINYYQSKDARIRAFFHKTNLGISKTFNELLTKARGKYVSFFASDDLWVKDKLKEQIKILDKNEDLVVWSDGLVIDEFGNSRGISFDQMHSTFNKKRSGFILEELLSGNYICGQSLILKKDNIKDIKLDENLKYLNDYKLMIDLASRYEFYFIKKPLIMYRIHNTNSILSNKKDWDKDLLIVYKYFLEKYGFKTSKKTNYYLFSRLAYLSYINNDKKNAFKYIFKRIKKEPKYLNTLLKKYAVIKFRC